MNFHVITSFNQKYFDELGQDCLDSYLKHWPADIPITCYVEGFRIDQYTDPRVHQVNFEDMPPGLSEFAKENQKSKTLKFAKKAFSIIHAMDNIECDVLIWIDADTMTHKDMTHEFLEQLIRNKLSVHLGLRYHEDNAKGSFQAGDFYCCETGFFMLNKHNHEFEQFKTWYNDIYHFRKTAVLRRFFDGDVYGYVIDQAISSDNYNDINVENIRTCFNRSVVGEYMAHWKGKNAKADKIGKPR
jgi:hypothetical protein